MDRLDYLAALYAEIDPLAAIVGLLRTASYGQDVVSPDVGVPFDLLVDGANAVFRVWYDLPRRKQAMQQLRTHFTSDQLNATMQWIQTLAFYGPEIAGQRPNITREAAQKLAAVLWIELGRELGFVQRVGAALKLSRRQLELLAVFRKEPLATVAKRYGVTVRTLQKRLRGNAN